MFEPIEFGRLNEAGVREEIIAPLLRELGYRTGTVNDVNRETSLRYPRASLGRKNQKKDPILRGKADYICEVQKEVRWVIEAKAPSVEIGTEEVGQSYLYANHPEVRAVYFCVCNGKELIIFQTNRGPDTPALKTFNYSEFNKSLEIIKNILGPSAILRDYPKLEPDTGEPIGAGLRSEVLVRNGEIVFKENSSNQPELIGYTLGIKEGTVRRSDKGQLIAFFKTGSPYQGFQDFNEKFGYDKFEVVSNDKILSTDKANPTIFRNKKQIVLPAGEKFFSPFQGSEVSFPIKVNCYTETMANGALSGKLFDGEFEVQYHYPELNLSLTMKGDFKIHLE
jgi:hypothetical protein